MNVQRVIGATLVGAATAVALVAPAAAAQSATDARPPVKIVAASPGDVCDEWTYQCGFRNGYSQGRHDAVRNRDCDRRHAYRSGSRVTRYWEGYNDGYDRAFRSFCR